MLNRPENARYVGAQVRICKKWSRLKLHRANSLSSFIPPQERAGAERINDLPEHWPTIRKEFTPNSNYTTRMSDNARYDFNFISRIGVVEGPAPAFVLKRASLID
jgi:hypothetical protein